MEGVGKRADAIAEYRRALLVNPRLEGARSALKRLGASEDPWLEWRDRAVAQARGLWIPLFACWRPWLAASNL